jgi:hypothetical protein
MRDRIGRIQRNRRAVLCGGLLAQARVEQQIPQGRVKRGARSRDETGFQESPRVRIPALLAEKGRQPGCGVAMPGLDLQRAAQAGFRRFRPVLCRLDHAQVGPGIGILWMKFHGPLKLGLGLRLTAEREKDSPIVIAVDGLTSPLSHWERAGTMYPWSG